MNIKSIRLFNNKDFIYYSPVYLIYFENKKKQQNIARKSCSETRHTVSFNSL